MTSMRSHDRYEDAKLAEEAADWLIKLDDDAGPETRAAFFMWIQQSARHVREFLFVTEDFRKLDLLDPDRRIEVDRLLAATDSNVVALQPSIEQENAPATISIPAAKVTRTIAGFRWAAGAAAIAAAAAVLIFVSPWSTTVLNRAQVYATSRGEQHSFKLADASVMHLNAESRVAVDYSGKLRRIVLLEGEALFIVAADSSRPFLVDAGSATVQAIGTQFNVYRRSHDTTVSVLEGAVRVVTKESDGASKAHSVSHSRKNMQNVLKVGEEARVDDGSDIVTRTAPDITRSVAWRQRRLVFRDDRLADVAKEFNRYNTTQVQVEGAARDKQLIGIFNADDPDSLLLFLAKDNTLRVEKLGERAVIYPKEP